MICGDYGTALTVAAFVGDKGIVLLLLDRGASINLVGGKYGTALAAAASGGSGYIVHLLLDRGADIDMVGGFYGTALAAAAFGGNIDIVQQLLNGGANINLVGSKYGTALTAAAFQGNMDIVQLLLNRGANINLVGGEYGTALTLAVIQGKMDIVLLLLNLGSNINAVDCEHGTALTTAAFWGQKDIVLLLLDRGADINTVGGEYGTALIAAAYWGNIDLVLLLLDRGANINLVGDEHWTAMAAAAFQGNMDIVQLLLNRGADINMVGGLYGTALTAAVFGEEMDIVLLLLDRGANTNTVDGENGTALAVAAVKGNMDIVYLLLDRGANINLVGGEYGTALAAAAFQGNMDIVQLLLNRGANINLVGGEYGTALAAAAFQGNMDIVRDLLYRGAGINTVCGKYGSVLTAAAFKGDIGIVRLLLDKGAHINRVAGEYGTALAAAVFRGNTDISLLLLQHGADVVHVGGIYSTASGVYPSALDVAYSEGSKAGPALLKVLKTAISKQNGSNNQQTSSSVDSTNHVISQPPFPMPCTLPYSALCVVHHNSTPPSSSIISSTEFCGASKITPEQADVLCKDGEALECSLAALVGLNEETTQAKHQWIQNDIRYFVTCNFDFGLAYAAARVAWKDFNEHSSSVISIQRSQWHKHAQVLDEARSKAIRTDHSTSVQELITSPYLVMPRRLWDLRSNRVVDFRMLHATQSTIKIRPTFWAVSHSWTGEMFPVWTTINQRQWPVPLPKNISIDYLRSELLTLGAEYVWIDVVCLRQQSEVDDLEQLRKEEWKLDVPTIGNIYRAAAKIVRYFNGLGVCFSNDGWDDSRHWLQRAWTLQEIANENTTINGGIAQNRGQVFLNTRGKVSGKVIQLRDAIRPVIKLAAQVDSPHGCEIYELAREMTRRYASQPVDKISGLFYLLRTTKLPCYDAQMTSEDFWRQCFHLLPAERKAEVLFDFPSRGSDEQWFPTWAQVLAWPMRNPAYDHLRPQSLPDLPGYDLGEGSFSINNIWTIPHAILYETDSYPGEYQVKICDNLFGFYLPYLSQEPINIEGQPAFTLAIIDLGDAHNWVVCRAVETRVADANLGMVGFNILKKVGVIRTDSCGELLDGGFLQRMDCLFV